MNPESTLANRHIWVGWSGVRRTEDRLCISSRGTHG